VILELHVQPGASRSEFAGEHGGRLKVRLAAPATEGRAIYTMQFHHYAPVPGHIAETLVRR